MRWFGWRPRATRLLLLLLGLVMVAFVALSVTLLFYVAENSSIREDLRGFASLIVRMR